MSKKLLLWDIDGTLIFTTGAGEYALVSAMEKIYGIKTNLSEVDYRGRTDVMISKMLMEKHGINPTPKALHDFTEAYLENLSVEIPKRGGHPYPGIIQILEEATRRPDISQGLLTGNLVRGAKIKLSHFNAWHYFEFGAFANDSMNRNELGPFALKRAKETLGIDFPPDHVYVIGDTPHDISCGKVIGAKTIAVATGGYTAAQLQAHHPTAVFDNFENPEKFFELLT